MVKWLTRSIHQTIGMYWAVLPGSMGSGSNDDEDNLGCYPNPDYIGTTLYTFVTRKTCHVIVTLLDKPPVLNTEQLFC